MTWGPPPHLDPLQLQHPVLGETSVMQGCFAVLSPLYDIYCISTYTDMPLIWLNSRAVGRKFSRAGGGVVFCNDLYRRKCIKFDPQMEGSSAPSSPFPLNSPDNMLFYSTVVFLYKYSPPHQRPPLLCGHL